MSELYIPPNCPTLEHAKVSQIRLGIQGRPGTGKTWGALTAKNPVIVDLDRKLNAHIGRKDVIVVPITTKAFCWDYMKVSNYPYEPDRKSYIEDASPNVRDSILRWLEKEATKLTEEQTLIIDSWTALQNHFHIQQDKEPIYTKGRDGKAPTINDFAPWQCKIEFSRKVCEGLKGLRCHVIVTFHEHAERDEKSGALLDTLQPLMQGKFIAELAGHFTDFVRARHIPKFDSRTKEQIVINAPPDGKYKIENDKGEWFWQVQPDGDMTAQITSFPKLRDFKYIPQYFPGLMNFL